MAQFKPNVQFHPQDNLEMTQRKLNELLKKLEGLQSGGSTTITIAGSASSGGGTTTAAVIGVRDVTGSIVSSSGASLNFDDADGFVVTNDGAYGSGYQFRIDLSQSIKATASPTFAGLTLSNLTATRVLFAGASKEVTDNAGMTFVAGTATLSVTNLTVGTTLTWSAGTATRIPYLNGSKQFADAAGLTWTAGTNTLTATNAVVSTQLTVGSLSGVLKATAGVVAGSATTADLTENTNLYYTDARARAAISASSPVAYDNGTGVISLGTVGIANGGTGQTTAMPALVALLPSLSGNNGKHLAVKSGETEVEWVTPSAGGGITTLNTLTADPQTFAKTDDTNVTLTITSATATHTFALGWSGELAIARGGTGGGTAAAARVNILPSLSGNAGKYLKVSAGETDVEWATVTGGGSPGGSDTHVQFNDGGSSFGGEAGFTYNKTTDRATLVGGLSCGAAPASAGAIRLSNNTGIYWRNADNDADELSILYNSSDQAAITAAGQLTIKSSDQIVYQGTTHSFQSADGLTGFGVIGSGYLTLGSAATSAAAGTIRLANAATIKWRNQAGTGDVVYGITVDTQDDLVLGDPSGEFVKVASTGVSVSALNGLVVGTLGALSAISAGTANQVFGMNGTPDGYEYKTISGTSNRVTVTHAANSITLSGPQDIHTSANPQFASLGLGVAASGTYIIYGKGNPLFEGTQGFNAAGETATLYLGDNTKGVQAKYGTGLILFVNGGDAISINENTMALTLGADLAITEGGTGASTAAGARSNILPSYTANALKVLRVNSGATDVEWATPSGDDPSSVDSVLKNQVFS